MKLESGIKNGTEATLKLSSNFVGDSNDDGNFLQRLLLIITQVSRIRKTFANGSSANVKFSKTQLSKMVKLARFLGRFLGLLIKTGLPSIRNVLKPLAKSLRSNSSSVSDRRCHSKEKFWVKSFFGLSTTNNNINNFK